MPVALLNAQLGIAHIGSELGAAPKMLLARMASPPRPQGGHGESKGTWGEGNQNNMEDCGKWAEETCSYCILTF